MKIGVRSVRENCGYSIEEMSEKLEISAKIYSFYEKHPRLIPVDIAVKIASIGGISLDHIFFG